MKYLAGLFTGVCAGIGATYVWATYLDYSEKTWQRTKEARVLFNPDGTPRNDIYATGSGSGRIPPNVGMFQGAYDKPRY